MFITLIYPTYEEKIPINSIIKFATYSHKIELTLSETSVKSESVWDFSFVTNRILEITQEAQPIAYKQIIEYLKS